MAPIQTAREKYKLQKQEKKKWKEAKLKKLQQKTPPEKITPPQESPEVSTISIAVPASILENAQSLELRTYLVGQIARAACIYQVDEIVVFDDVNNAKRTDVIEEFSGVKTASKASTQLVRILQYLECPQYLRKFLFPIHHDLKFAGILNPLEAPHHLRMQNTFQFREGVVTNKPSKNGAGSKVNVGLLKDVEVDKQLMAGFRCTVKLLAPADSNTKKLKGVIVAPSTPRRETGIYWGYSVRLANSLVEVFSKSPYKNGYSLILGTSDKGDPIDEFECPEFDHMLIMFGGLYGLEAALESEEKLDVNDPKLLFDFYLNTVPSQGSRTIRTEEAILISLAELRRKLNFKVKPMEFTDFEAIASS